MLVLSKGSFMGPVARLNDMGGIITSLSCYHGDAPYDEHLHCHETLHLSMVLQGGNIEKRKIKQIDCLPGTVTFYDAWEPHYSVHIIPGSCQVNLEIADGFIAEYDLSVRSFALEKSNPADTRFLMLKVYRELLVNDLDSSLSVTSALLRALYFSGKAASDQSVPNWVPLVKEMLHDRWNDHITLNELGLIASLHPANLSGYFPKYFGCTIGEYRRKLKIEKALELIKTSSVSLTTIAHRAGFADQSHFTRACKELTGWNPKQLRAMQFK